MVTASTRARIVEARSYLRPLNAEGTVLETPEQGIDRVISHQRWLWSRQLGRPLYGLEEGELAQLRELLVERKLCLAGRTRWLGGTDVAKKREASQFNPLPRETSFVTDKGVRSFYDVEDGDYLTVLTHEGNFKRARATDAGTRDMLTLMLRRGRSIIEQRTSEDHTWVLKDGQRVLARDLKQGDQLAASPRGTLQDWEFEEALPDEQMWWCYGFTFGDGALSNGTSRVRLCGNKARYLSRFTECGFQHSFPPSCGDDPFVYTGKYLKTLPSDAADERLIQAFLRGYLDADANKKVGPDTTRFTGLTVSDANAADFVRRWAPRFGLYILSDTHAVRETNYGTFVGTKFSFTTGAKHLLWTVESVKMTAPEPCWCLTVDDDHSFVLPNGVVTGNCSFLEVRTVHDVVDVLWLLLQGCGVGFRMVPGILNGFANKMEIEIIRTHRDKNAGGLDYNTEDFNPQTGVWTIRIGDSSAAWAKSIGKIMAGKHGARKLIIDFREVRGAGGRLRGYGWISSGDEQIARAYAAICEIMNNRAGELLTRIDLLDILNWLGMTLSSRRSAEIAMLSHGEPEWEEFAVAKKDHMENDMPHRGMSNNSLIFNTKPTKYQLKKIFKTMLDSGGSEPGFINGVEAQRRAPWFKGVNPCVPGDTMILTREGYVPIIERVGKMTDVWNGTQWSSVEPFSTGTNPLVNVVLSDGTSLKCTPAHQWIVKDNYRSPSRRVSADKLSAGMHLAKFDMPIVAGGADLQGCAYSQGFYSGDGNTGLEHSWVYEPKFSVIPRLCGDVTDVVKHGRVTWKHGPMREKTFVPLNASLAYRADWIAGLFDADGCVVRDVNGNGLQLVSTELEFLKAVRLLLTTLGCQAKIIKANDEGHVFDGYSCRACWRILINSTDTQRLVVEAGVSFSRLVVHANPPQRDARRFVTVVTVEELPDSVETFCFTEPHNHTGTFNGIVTGQCGEILLGDKSFCNLVEIVLPRFNGDEDGLQHAVWLAARANYRQTCVDLRDGVLQEGWHQLNEFLRLCGVGVTGVVAWEHRHEPDAWKDMRSWAVQGACAMAVQLGTPLPKAVTTVKPSGTASKTCGIVGMEIPEGVHMPKARYIFNNVRFSAHDPLLGRLEAANYHTFVDPYDPTGVLVRLPVEYSGVEFTHKTLAGGRVVEIDTEPAIEQLERYKLLMENYVDHNCSITVQYLPEEVPEIVDWLIENWDTYVGVSFLLRQDVTRTAADLGYPYLPQEVVTADEYREYVAELLPVDFDGTGSLEAVDTGPECSTGACPIR